MDLVVLDKRLVPFIFVRLGSSLVAVLVSENESDISDCLGV